MWQLCIILVVVLVNRTRLVMTIAFHRWNRLALAKRDVSARSRLS